MRVLVTGAAGSLGQALVPQLCKIADTVWATDRDEVDVTDPASVDRGVSMFEPDVIYHLAGAKHAPEGEVDPAKTLRVNADGTANVVRHGIRTITASTCKAADPETVYGASKLIAERITLDAGGSVARFYNVEQTCGNVFEIWRETPEDQPLSVASCFRYFMSRDRAVWLLLRLLDLPPGRYTVDPGKAVAIEALAAERYPGREVVHMAPRRGDRVREPRKARSEWLEEAAQGIERIVSVHDAQTAAADRRIAA